MVKAKHTEPLFLGRSLPLSAAARALLDGAHSAGDLAHICVVVPGSRAGRQLLLALAEEAADRGVPLRPPQVRTPGQLEDVLRPPRGVPIASDIEVRLAVSRALEATVTSQRERMVLAQRYMKTNRELTAACLTWEQVAEAAVAAGGDPERYVEIDGVFKAAVQTLESLGLKDADTARKSLLDSAPLEGLEVVLLGVVELPERIRRAMSDVPVRPFVVGVEDDAAGFDELGLIRTDWWLAHVPEVPSARIHIEDKPIDQAEWVRERLASLTDDGEIDPDLVALVLADESIADPLERELADAGCPVHRAQGRRVNSLAPASVLTHVAEYLELPTVATLRTLLGHPAVEDAVIARFEEASAMRPVRALDLWLQHRYSRPIASGWIGDPLEKGIRSELAMARRVLGEVDRVVSLMLAPLLGEERIAGEWMQNVVDLLVECFGEKRSEQGACIEEALASICNAAADIVAAPQELQWPSSASDGIRMLLSAIGEEPIRPSTQESVALEMLGWLEVPFDPAPNVIVTGFNDGSVPNVGGIDPLLPDLLRGALGLASEGSRTARDAWVLSCALERDVQIVVSRRDIRGESRVPSRLLLSAQGNALAQRVLDLTRNAKPRSHPGSDISSFGRPRPRTKDNETSIELPYISVTGFRQYLRCPYGYWLRYILRVKPPEITGREFDARAFGSILHAAVEQYALKPEANQLLDQDEIETILFDALDAEIVRLAGTTLAVGLRLQSHVLRQRLSRIADVFAQQRNDGWKIHFVEHEFSTSLLIPGQASIDVHGKADLIEFHPEHGWRILDFKTSDRGTDPDKAHHKPVLGEWIDLQLPLYRKLLGEELRKIFDEPITTGYFLAPADLTQVGIKMSHRICNLHDEAIAKAQEVVMNIRSGAFEPGSKLPLAEDETALIYRVHSIGDAGESEGAA